MTSSEFKFLLRMILALIDDGKIDKVRELIIKTLGDDK